MKNYRLLKLIKLKSKIKSKSKLLKVEKIIEHFALANGAYELYQEHFQKWVEKDENAFKFLSAIYSIYSNGNISLFLAKNLNKSIQDTQLKTLRNSYKIWAIKFNSFRNDTTAHPINDNYFCEIIAYGNDGDANQATISVSLLNTKNLKPIKQYEINPDQEIKILHEYLEKLGEIYEKHLI